MSVDQWMAQELEELCELASLHLDPAEKKHFGRSLGALLRVLGKIEEVDTAGAPPTAHQLQGAARLREDEVTPSLSRELVFENTAHRSDDYFRVPRIAGDESDQG